MEGQFSKVKWSDKARQSTVAMQQLYEAYELSVQTLEKTLDEYCYESFSKNLQKRDRDQVLSRHINKPEQTHEIAAVTKGTPRHACEHPQQGDDVPVVVVSQLVAWRFGGLLSPHVSLFYPRQRLAAR